MEIKQLSERTTIISFDDPYLTNVGVIFAANGKRVFVLDTFLGSESMAIVRGVIADQAAEDWPVTVFNSHADYDHIWGNGTFCDSTIIGHHLCRERVLSESAEAIVKYAQHKRGTVEIVPPNFTFGSALAFPKEHIIIEHTPGHTVDSASLSDTEGRLLFVGDNVEPPVPYVNTLDFDGFLNSLRGYLEQDWDYLLASHCPLMTDYLLLNANIRYLEQLKNWEYDIDSARLDEVHIHLHNLDSLSSLLITRPRSEEVKRHFQLAIAYAQSLDDSKMDGLLSRIRRVVS